MVKNQRRHAAAFEFRVAPEAVEFSKTISQLSSEHEIHANLIRTWKRQLLEDGPNAKCSAWPDPRSSTPTRALSSKPMPSPPACSQPTFKSASMAAGRPLDNVFCQRLWRSVKYENIYLNQNDTVRQFRTCLTAYFDFYNHERPHQSLNYRTPAEEHFVL